MSKEVAVAGREGSWQLTGVKSKDQRVKTKTGGISNFLISNILYLF